MPHIETRDAEEADLVFKLAESKDELLQAYRLLYNEYFRAGYTPARPDGMLFTRHHLHPGTRVLVACYRERVVSTAAIVGDSREMGLPMDELYRGELAVLRRQGRNVAEVCSLASDRSGLAPSLIRLFTRTLFLCSLHLNFDDVCVMVNPKHVPLYRRWCDLEILGFERHYSKVNAPAVALRTDLHKARQYIVREWPQGMHKHRLKEEYRRHRVDLDGRLLGILSGSGDSADASPLDAGLACRMLSTGAGLLCGLSPECRTLLRKSYPGLII
jgi:hypothetical protein